MAERLRTLQERFAAHLRDPAANPAPDDVEDRRMAIYRRLFFNNVSNLVARSFPVLRRLHDDDAWRALIRDFYAHHVSRTPLFPELPREFLRYLQDERGERPEDPPYMAELAHWEWVELALDLDERDLDAIPADRDGDLLAGAPVLSPLAWPLAFRWPVHRIGPRNRPAEPPQTPTHLLVYRNREHAVKFIQLNGVSARVITLLQEGGGRSGREVLQAVADELAHPRPERLAASGAKLLRDLAQRDIILGVTPGH